MDEDFINTSELGKFETTIAEVTSKANSLDELEAWLQSQPWVEFVKLEEYVVKTFPPRREITIGLKMEGGSIREKVLIIQVTDDNKFEFKKMREPN